MPFIHITSLPFAAAFDVPAAIIAIGNEFSAATDIPAEHVTVTWRYLAENHYAINGATAAHQPGATHPLLVELLAPDFNTPEQVATMLRALARSVAAHCSVAEQNIFIDFRAARSGCVFDDGEIVHWR